MFRSLAPPDVSEERKPNFVIPPVVTSCRPRLFEYTLGSPEWEEKVAASKFDQWPAYGRATEGHIGLQDHGDPVWYRNIKIRELGR